jgi:tellurite resistance protein TehA-like permease
MQHTTRHRHGILRLLITAAAAGFIACVVALGLVSTGALVQPRANVLILVATAGLLAVGLALLVAEWRARSPRREILHEPLEMSTLTFPPSSLGRRRRA